MNTAYDTRATEGHNSSQTHPTYDRDSGLLASSLIIAV